MPDMFAGRGFSFDLAGTVVGISKILSHSGGFSDVSALRMQNLFAGFCVYLGNALIKSKDVIIGVHSSGLHSNGYTLARKALLLKVFTCATNLCSLCQSFGDL